MSSLDDDFNKASPVSNGEADTHTSIKKLSQSSTHPDEWLAPEVSALVYKKSTASPSIEGSNDLPNTTSTLTQQLPLPHSRQARPIPSALAPPHTPQQTSPSRVSFLNINILSFLTLICIVVIALGTFSYFIYSEDAQRNDFQNQADQHSLELKQKQLIFEKLEVSNEKIHLIKQHKELDSEETLNSLIKERDALTLEFSNYSLTPDEHSFFDSIKASEFKMQQYETYSLYTLFTLTIPFLIAILHFWKSCLTLFRKAPVLLSILHCIPVIHFIMYAVVSTKWNIESVQRKNSLFHTLPLSISALTTSILTIYQYSLGQHHWPALAAISTLLWGVVHIRQIQMLEYMKRQSQLH